MKIRYLGHSCFLLTASNGVRIVADPYGDVGFSMPRVSADYVTVSHSHYDHCNIGAVRGTPVVVSSEGTFSLGGVTATAVPCFHDAAEGRKRGKNLMFRFCIDGLNVCHLGDLGEPCSEALLEKIRPVDVLLLPVGGTYTIDAAQAREYLERLSPSVAIPMHYKVKDLDLDVDGVQCFTGALRDRGTPIEEAEGEIELSERDKTEGKTRVIVMKRSEKE